MEYIAVLEGLNGLQFPQQSRKAVGSNSWQSVGSPRVVGCPTTCDYEASAECTYEMSAECGYEASAPCEYEMSAPCEYESSFNCDAPCAETIPTYVPPPQVFVPQQPVPQLQPVPQQAAQPVPSYVPVATPGVPATVQYQLVPTYLPAPGVVVTVADCGPRSVRNPDGSCSELQGLNVASVKGTLGRLGKVFGK